jgi:hypothetical protein
MTTYTIYNPSTGEITGTFTGDPTSQRSNILDPTSLISYIDGQFDHLNYYVDLTTKLPVEKPHDPSNGQSNYKFNFSTKQWVYDSETSATLVRQSRNFALEEIDKVSVVWYNTLTDQQKTELNNYRQDLLAIPQQTGFPESVTWPAKPEWL